MTVNRNHDYVVFDAASETFEKTSFFDAHTAVKRCSAVMGKVNNTIGVMVVNDDWATIFSDQDFTESVWPWKDFRLANSNSYTAPLLGRVSSDAMVLIGLKEEEIFHKMSPSWENMALNISLNIIGYP